MKRVALTLACKFITKTLDEVCRALSWRYEFIDSSYHVQR
jgi:hypothetical protein